MTLSPRLIHRPMQGDRDFWRIRDLIVETYPITPRGLNWDIRRWEGHRFYEAEPAFDPAWQDRVHLWETETGRLLTVWEPNLVGGVPALALSPDGRHLAVGGCGERATYVGPVSSCVQGAVELWDVASGEPDGPPLIGYRNGQQSPAAGIRTAVPLITGPAGARAAPRAARRCGPGRAASPARGPA